MSDQTTVERSELLEVARAAAVAAAELLMTMDRGGDVEVTRTKSSSTDIVTNADAAAEALLRQRLFDSRPGDSWLGEESGSALASPAATRTRVRWIVDPLDGTVNYLYGLPGWAVSVAAEDHGRVVAGCVVVPATGEVFCATLGGGATCNGRPLRAGACGQLSEALVMTGFSYDSQTRARQGDVVGRLLPHVRDIRRSGAAAADFCTLAAGRVDAFYEGGLQPWDRAAGVLIAREAGAIVEEAPDGSVVAAPEGLFVQFHGLVADLWGSSTT